MSIRPAWDSPYARRALFLVPFALLIGSACNQGVIGGGEHKEWSAQATRGLAGVVALDAATGQLKWEKKRQSICAFATPVVWDTPGGKQVAAAGYGRMIGYDLKSGEEKWSVAGMPSECCASPVTA